jgi:hypothetical protein
MIHGRGLAAHDATLKTRSNALSPLIRKRDGALRLLRIVLILVLKILSRQRVGWVERFAKPISVINGN